MKAIRILLLLVMVNFMAVYSSAQNNTNTGIGIFLVLDSIAGYPKINWIIVDAPAEKAGLMRGDLIVSVNSISIFKKSLEDAIKIMKGEEGTTIQLKIKRDGKEIPYSIVRETYTYSNSFYVNPKPDDAFLSGLFRIMNDAPYWFKHTKSKTPISIDSSNVFHTLYYQSLVTLPGVEKIIFSNMSMDSKVDIILGTYDTKDMAFSKLEEQLTKLQGQMPEFYFEPVKSEEDGSKYIVIGKKFKDGYEEARMTASMHTSKTGYEALLTIFADDHARNYIISGEAANDEFSTSVRRIMQAVPEKFESLKGTLHPRTSDYYNNSWYELNTIPAGAANCEIRTGSLGTQCLCFFYEGTSYDDAYAVYKKLFSQIRKSLGSSYVYNFEKPFLSDDDPSSKIANFAHKSKKESETCPNLALHLNKDEGGKYLVSIIFDNSGM